MARMIAGALLVILFCLRSGTLAVDLANDRVHKDTFRAWKLIEGYGKDAAFFESYRSSILNDGLALYALFHLAPGLVLLFFGYRAFSRKRRASGSPGRPAPTVPAFRSSPVLLGIVAPTAAAAVLTIIYVARGTAQAESRKLLAATLKDEKSPVASRVAAATRLGELGVREAVAPLIRQLHPPWKTEVRDAAKSALARLGPIAIPGLVADLGTDRNPLGNNEVEEVLASFGPRVVPAVSAALAHRDPKVREAAAETLGAVRDDSAVEALRQALLRPESDGPCPRCFASLAAQGGAGVKAVVAFVESEERGWKGRRWAAAAAVRDARADSLRAVPGTATALVEILRREHGEIDYNVVNDLAAALAKIGPDARPALQTLLAHPEEYIRDAANRTLGIIDRKAASP